MRKDTPFYQKIRKLLQWLPVAGVLLVAVMMSFLLGHTTGYQQGMSSGYAQGIQVGYTQAHSASQLSLLEEYLELHHPTICPIWAPSLHPLQ